jgi:hypothetical protein
MNFLRCGGFITQNIRKLTTTPALEWSNKKKGGKTWFSKQRNRKEWYNITLTSMAGTGSTKSWVRHQNGESNCFFRKIY